MCKVLQEVNQHEEMNMGRIIRRNITNEDGDVYGVVGNITRLGAYRAIRKDMDGYGILGDIEFTADDLEEAIYSETKDCPHGGEHDGWIWWGELQAGDKIVTLGKGWILKL